MFALGATRQASPGIPAETPDHPHPQLEKRNRTATALVAQEAVMIRIVSVLALCVLVATVGSANAQFVRDVSESSGPTERVSTKPVRPVIVSVDCTRGQSLNKALGKLTKESNTESVIEIHGICEESVVLRGLTNVTLRGTDAEEDGISWGVPDDGLVFPYNSALMIVESNNVRVENLMITGWRPLRLAYADLIEIVNCRLLRMEGGRPVVYVTHSNGVNLVDSAISSPGSYGLIALWSAIRFTNSTVSAGPLGIAVWAAADVTVVESFVAATWIGIYSGEGSGVWLEDSRVESIDSALYAELAGNIWMNNGEIAGGVASGGNSSVVLGNVTQTDQGGDHVVAERSSLNLWNGTQLQGPIFLYEFSDAVVQHGSGLFGEFHCWSGADAFCEDPASVWGAYGCPSTPGFAAAESARSRSDRRQDLRLIRADLRSLMEEEKLF
jgi:hypothetical protein